MARRLPGSGSGSGPHKERPPALTAFTQALWDAWVKAGPISYSVFEKRSEEMFGRSRRLAASTTQEILTGQRSGPAHWDWVRRFWSVLRAVAADHDINPDSLGALEALKGKHEAALAEHRRQRRPGGAAGIGTEEDAAPGATAGHNPEPGYFQAQSFPSASSEAEALAEIRQKIGVEWWSDYQDVVPGWAGTYLSLEPATELIHCYETAVVPGLLQTAPYAGVALRQAPDAQSEADINRLVELRMRRQEILWQPDPPRLWAVFHEAALLRWLGDDPTILRTQISHLIEIAELPNITIQLIPSGTRIRALLGYPITLLRFRVREITDVVYFEQLTSALYLNTPDQASRYAQVLTGLSAEALHPARTVSYLHRKLRDSR